jgi:GTP-binding protein
VHIGGYVDQADRAAVIVVNKWDLAPEMGLTEAAAAGVVRERFKFLHNAPVLFTCALTGRGVSLVPARVVEVYDEFTRTLPQDRLSSVLADALAKRPPPSKPGMRVRISQVSQTRTAPPTLTLRASYPELIHFSYRRYLANRFREAFGFSGSPLKLEFVAESA